MTKIITQDKLVREEWLQQLADVITDPTQLLKIIKLDHNKNLCEGIKARRLFPFRIPRIFAAKIKPGDPNDPLLCQIITKTEEFNLVSGYCTNPLNEQNNDIPNLLHKYHNRALILLKNICAINCRYCFRKHFPYDKNHNSKLNLLKAITYIKQHNEINEVILSGGDPLMAKDHELNNVFRLLEEIPHLTTLRIHSRLPVVIPARITKNLCKILTKCRLNKVLVTHINHANEIDDNFYRNIAQLHKAKVTLLNQSVLLYGVNDNSDTLANLSKSLLKAGILPYYLHLLDKVQGSAHFMVSDIKARKIIKQLLEKVSGYLVPRLVREINGKYSKVLLDLNIK